MKRVLVPAFVVVLGSVLGACTMFVVDDAAPSDLGVPTGAPPVVKPIAVTDPTLLVWTPDGLDPAIARSVASLPSIRRVTEVRGDLVELVDPNAPAGYVVPLDALSIDPVSYASFLPKGPAGIVAALEPGEAVLGATSARLRDAGVGATLTLVTGETVSVVAVLDDELVGAAELMVVNGTVASIDTPRFALVSYDGPREAIELEIRALLPAATAVRFRAPGETPLLRHGDAVQPQVALKEQFGEFSYRRAPDNTLDLDPAWVDDHIVDAEMPLLGRVRCHRAIVDELRAALVELEQRNLGYLVSADGYRGCYVPRLIGADAAVSRHAWGIALDVNWPKNLEGEQGSQDPRLVQVMTEHGFAWGGPWLVPDPAHFEWVTG